MAADGSITMPDAFVTTPPIFHLFNFATKSVDHIYVVLGNAPKAVVAAVLASAKKRTKMNDAVLKEFYGDQFEDKLALAPGVHGGSPAGLSISDSDLLALGITSKVSPAAAPAHEAPGRVIYNTNVHIYPFDKLSELREKIYLIMGIPPYRQHVFCDSVPYVMYRIFLHGIYPVDIREETDSTMAGLPIDRYLFENKDGIRIETFDSFQIAESLHWPLQVVDLNAVISNARTQITDNINDAYQMQLIYNGFIVKFWPMLCQQCFLDYLVAEEDLLLKYPGFYRPLSIIGPMYKQEAALLNKDMSIKHPPELPVSIIRLNATIRYPSRFMELRSIFDKFATDEKAPALHVYLENDGKKYLIKKTHIHAAVIKFPPNTAATSKKGRPVLVVAIKTAASSYIFLQLTETGLCSLKTEWNEEDLMQMEDLPALFKTFVNPIIDRLNEAGAHIDPVRSNNVSYKGMTAAIYWKKSLGNKEFRMVADAWADYINAGILIGHGQHTNGRIEYIFRKFMFVFDPTIVEKILRVSSDIILHNFYAYLSSAAIQTKWMQHYDGRPFAMIHRTMDVRFEIVDIHEREFPLFYRILQGFVRRVSGQVGVPTVSVASTHKLRRLKEQDPVLFNFGNYSVACQKPMQPFMHSTESALTTKSRVTKYWNFTTQQPVYYSCPNPKYPQFGFIKDIHPSHYCVPCCYKMTHADDKYKKSKIIASCLATHMHTGDESADNVSHVLDYSKDITPGRFAKLPALLNKLLGNPSDRGGQKYLFYGVPQHVPGVQNVGVVFCIAACLDVAVSKLVGQWCLALPGIFDTLLKGALVTFFASAGELVTVLSDLFIADKAFTVTGAFERYNELFCELCLMVNKYQVIVFEDVKMDGKVTLQIDQLHKTGYIAVTHQGSSYYPLILVSHANTIRILQWVHTTGILADLIEKLGEFAKEETKDVMRPLDLAQVIAFCTASSGAITLGYLGRTGSLYAVLLQVEGRTVYCPVAYTNDRPSAQCVYEPYHWDPPINRADVEWFVNALNAFLPADYERVILDPIAGGFQCQTGVFYCSDAPRTWDPTEVNISIMNREPPLQDKTQELPRALYETRQYELFLMEFIRFLHKDKNTELRARIGDLIGHCKKIDRAFRDSLRAIVPGTDDLHDLWAVIDSSVRVHHSTDLSKQAEWIATKLDSCKFSFDRSTAARLNAMPLKDATAAIVDLSRNFAQEKNAAEITDFPNIYTVCADMNPRPSFCCGDKLIVTGDLAAFAELAAGDIRNPLKARYLFEEMRVVIINYLDFIKRPTEVIEVIRRG
jgi:hypothetical protein